jgi:hypothetical protein
MKIFNNNKKRILKTVTLKSTENTTGKVKLLPSFSKEWKNLAFFYNKNSLKNIPNNNIHINKIIRGYFNLYLKDSIDLTNLSFKRIIRRLGRKTRSFSRIFVSNAEIKYVNHKAKITLYMVNREKNILKKKFFYLNKIIMGNSLKNNYYKHYKKSIIRIHSFLEKFNYKYIFISSVVRKKDFMKYKLKYLNRFIYFKHLYLNSIIKHIAYNYLKNYSKLLVKYKNKYTLTQSKLSNLLPVLNETLQIILGKKIEYNVINIKSFSNNSDIFTNMLSILIKRRKKNISLAKYISQILKKVRLPKVNRIKERTRITHNINKLLMKYNDSKLISTITNSNNISSILNSYNELNINENKIHQSVFNSINYKNMSGMRIEVRGRLTKRYRADRAIYRLKYKGGLRNVYSSYQGISSVLFRGNTKSNASYSFLKSKRRIGSFAIKGWIGGK